MARAPTPTLMDLADGRFDTEPRKNTRGGGSKPNWTLNSRYLLLHLFYNVLEQKRGRTKKGALPKLGANELGRMTHPLAANIVEYRSRAKTLGSLKNAQTYQRPARSFTEPTGTPTRAVIKYNTVGYDNVERIFTQAGESIPLNLDKRGRRAFVVPPTKVPATEIPRDSLDLLGIDQPPSELPEWSWFAFDWSQAELFKLYLFSGDDNLKRALLSSDVHRYVAARMFGIAENQVTKIQRDAAKTFQYALIYSGFDLHTAAAIIMTKNSDLEKTFVDETLQKYAATFNDLFKWVGDTLFDWYDNNGTVTYLLGAKKTIPVSSYLKRDLPRLRSDKGGRTAINTYGQNSVGLLLKVVYSQMLADSDIRENTRQHIPLFDAMYMLVRTSELGRVAKKINRLARVVLQFEGRSIQMAAEYSTSTVSWGDLEKTPYSENPEDPLELKWKMPEVPADNLTPFSGTGQVPEMALEENATNPFR